MSRRQFRNSRHAVRDMKLHPDVARAGRDEHDTYTDDLEDWLQRVPPVAHKNTSPASEVHHG